jgi:hypothetical protein
MSKILEVHDTLLSAARKLQAEGSKIVRQPVLDGECCPVQALALARHGSFGLMGYPWDRLPALELGITRDQLWNVIAGFDDRPPGSYTGTGGKEDGPSHPDFYQLGQLLAAELL